MAARARIIKAAAGASYSRLVLIAGQILTVPVLVTRWGPATYGAWITITALASYLSYSAVGLAPALRSDMALNFDTGGERSLRTTFQTSLTGLLISTGLAGAAFVLALHVLPLTHLLHLATVSDSDARQIATAVAVQVVLSLVYGVVAAALSAVGEFGGSQTIEATRSLLDFVLLVVLVGGLRFSPAEMAMVYPFTAAGGVVVALFELQRRAPWLFVGLNLDLSVFRRLLRPMLGAVMLSFGYTGLSVQAPRLIIAATLGPSAVATYALAGMMLRIARIPIEIPAFATTVEMSLAYGRGDVEAARGLLANSTRFTLWLALLILPFVVALGGLAALIWTGGRIHIPAGVLALLSLASVAYAIGLPSQETLMALNRLALATTWLALLAIPFMVVCSVLSRGFGLEGAALSVVVLELVFATTTVSMSLKSLGLKFGAFARAIIRAPHDILLKELAAFRPARLRNT